ncbi:hypothetical protein DF024_35830 [Burkholderia cenocepacia]|nr:hypothetical protein DF024_35830 [Burkholderia cenocepacia]
MQFAIQFRKPNRSASIVKSFAILLLALAWHAHAQAKCMISQQFVGEVTTAVYRVSFGTLPSFDPTVPDGTVLGRVQGSMGDISTSINGCKNPDTVTGGTRGATTRMFTTLTDASHSGNRSDVLGLTPGPTAKGVGVRIMNQSTRVSYGPDSSAAGNPNQWFVTETGNQGVDIPLTAHYVRTGNVTAGTADAVATFTMSYQ